MTPCRALDSADYVRVINAFIVLYCGQQACALLLYSVRTQHLSRKITRIIVAFFVSAFGRQHSTPMSALPAPGLG